MSAQECTFLMSGKAEMTSPAGRLLLTDSPESGFTCKRGVIKVRLFIEF